MDHYRINTPEELITGNPYVGRGLVIGKTPDNTRAVSAYFIMGRSANSKNRIFTLREDVFAPALYTAPFDSTKVTDPSLIIYPAMRQYENSLIVTNGDQTDTVYEGLKSGKTFFEALGERCFEPDAPNFTPRISGLLSFADGDCSYQMSILKSLDAEGTACARYGFDYPSMAGLGHFIHTYVCDGNPLPSFVGEPERMQMEDEPDAFAARLWDALDADNRISLYVRYIDLKTFEIEDRLINKNR